MASASDSTRLPVSQQGPVTKALSAMRQEPEPQPERRGFLRQLLTLPLLGGAVSLIGAPTAVALPCTRPALEAYADWLAREYGEILIELAPLDHPDRTVLPQFYEYARQHAREWCDDNLTLTRGRRVSFKRPPAAPPSTRAALVLSAVGCDWRR